jgi:NADH-quinone oxidoreductase subunit L
MSMIELCWLIPLLPLIGFVVIAAGNSRLPKAVVSVVGCGSVFAAFGVALGVFSELLALPEDARRVIVPVYEWIATGDSLRIDFAFLVDPLSSVFVLVITGVGSLIHVYSTGYMHDDSGYHRFFAFLNLFVFFMLLLVLGSSLALTFVGWEGVGLCSYLLIGFWFKNPEYNKAANKAFIVNRIGDLGFLLGMLLFFVTFGTLNYDGLANVGQAPPAALTAIGLLLLVGACGKSAQIPLYTWLPDAMAGPTPVSALIHAATMVTSGIYMVARCSTLFEMAPVAQEAVAAVGLVTAVFAASIGLLQNDIKKVLAYSTVSQLGYMFLGLGSGAYTGAVFHVVTHAFFKALLFLGAGSVMGGEQDIRRMGGLARHVPATRWTFLIGTIAISGIPPLSGFFSKDEILAAAYEFNPAYWAVASCGAVLTAFYMFRVYFLVFHGEFRGTEHQRHHLHESPPSMTVPLWILAALSAFGGLLGIPHLFGEGLGVPHYLEEYLKPSLAHVERPAADHAQELLHISIVVVAVVLAIGYAFVRYNQQRKVPSESTVGLNPVAKLVYNKYYVDELYSWLVERPLFATSRAAYRFLETVAIDGVVMGLGWAAQRTGSILRRTQSGQIGFYTFAMVVAVAALVLAGLLQLG